MDRPVKVAEAGRGGLRLRVKSVVDAREFGVNFQDRMLAGAGIFPDHAPAEQSRVRGGEHADGVEALVDIDRVPRAECADQLVRVDARRVPWRT